MRKAKIKLAIITNTIGYDGNLFVATISESIKTLKKDAMVYIGYSEQFSNRYSLEHILKIPKGFNIKLKEINSKETAKQFMEMAVYVDEEDVIKKTDKNYYSEEIVGFQVIDKGTGKLIGIISDIFSIPSNDVFTIDSGGREILIPVIEDIVKSIDYKKKIIAIDVIPGLLEANVKDTKGGKDE